MESIAVDKINIVNDHDVFKKIEEDKSVSTASLSATSCENTETLENDPICESKACPLQIVSFGNKLDENSFTFDEKKLNCILSDIPLEMKVCIVSVVGAFRSGKSSLLSWFLRYLHHEKSISSPSVSKDEGETSKKWFETFDSLGNDGFNWGSGAEHSTAGIWMWSEPYILPWKVTDNTTENIAVLLVDSQGLTDHGANAALNGAIFGLSTLLSSYQIYNIEKRIQKDNIEQLSLFHQYSNLKNNGLDDGENSTKETVISTDSEKIKRSDKTKPFQKVEFLVRDWQNFECEDDLEACEIEMESYLKDIMADRESSTMNEIYEQVSSCYDDISCYQLTHPGLTVTRKNYSGSISTVDPTFVSFIDRYCQKVFGNLVAKSINGRELTATELGLYFCSYAKLFEHETRLPDAVNILQASTDANNIIATNSAMKSYKESMKSRVGELSLDYVSQSELSKHHKSCREKAHELFNSMFEDGKKSTIEEAKETIKQSINKQFKVSYELNESRKPKTLLMTGMTPFTNKVVTKPSFIGQISFMASWLFFLVFLFINVYALSYLLFIKNGNLVISFFN